MNVKKALIHLHMLVTSSHNPGWQTNREAWATIRAALAETAQPVEAVDGLTHDDLREVQTYVSESSILHAKIGAALAHPRPTSDTKVLTTQAILDRIEAVARQADSAGHSADEMHLRNTLGIIADDLTAIIAAERVYAPTVEQAGELVRVDSVAYRYRKRGCGGTWRYGSVSHRNAGRGPDPKVFEVEMLARTEDAQPSPVGVPDDLSDPDNPWRRAVEHAGYLVTAVAHYLEASSNAGIAIEQVEGIEGPSDRQLEELHSAQEDADEARTSMRDLSYEFTKRRDRALATLTAAPAPAKAGEGC